MNNIYLKIVESTTTTLHNRYYTITTTYDNLKKKKKTRFRDGKTRIIQFFVFVFVFSNCCYNYCNIDAFRRGATNTNTLVNYYNIYILIYKKDKTKNEFII